MTDKDLQAVLLKIFYEGRADGYLGLDNDGESFRVPSGLDPAEVLRACGQLEAAGLIEWKGLHDVHGNPAAGRGRILEAGIAAVEAAPKSPATNSAESPTKVDEVIATYYLERIVAALVATAATDDENETSRLRLAEFLDTPGARRIFPADVNAVLAPLISHNRWS